MHILYVEDSQSSALPVIEFLKKQGYRVTFVQNGRDALTAYQAETPDLVLMDIVMPEMDGIEATRRIKAISGARWVPVIVMTALSAKHEIVAGLNAGADDYLAKPVMYEVLEARIRSMQRIATIQKSLVAVLDNVYEGIITIDMQGIVRSYNKAAERIFGYTAAEAVGRNVKFLMPAPYTEEHDGYLARYLKERVPHVIGIGRKVQGLRKNGEVFPMKLAVTQVPRGNGLMFIGLVSDISEEVKAQEHIEFLALHDPLTRLSNRRHFNETLDALLRQQDGGQHALLFIDLDGFKVINDTLGHEAGDEVLVATAGRIRNNLTGTDFVARLGGDEFVAILHNISGSEAVLAIANRIVAAVSRPMSLPGRGASVGASIGIAMMPQHGGTTGELLAAADRAMYVAKIAGKGRCILAE